MVQQTREDEDDVFVEKLNNALFLFLGILTISASLIMLMYSATVVVLSQQFSMSFLYTSIFSVLLFVAGLGLLYLFTTRRRRREKKRSQILPVSKARPHLSIFIFLLLLGLSNLVLTANATAKIYTWYPSPGDHGAFAVWAGVEDHRATEVPMSVHLKATLIAKPSTFDHVDSSISCAS